MSQPIKGFHIFSRAHYARAGQPKEIMIGLYHSEGGTSGEFAIRWHDIGSQKSFPRLEIFDDAWKVFFDMPELCGLSTLTGKNADEQQIIDFLIAAGFKDLTRYDGPKPAKPVITVTIEGGLVQEVTGIPNGYELHVEDHDEGDETQPQYDPEKGCFVTVYEGGANG